MVEERLKSVYIMGHICETNIKTVEMKWNYALKH